MLDPHTPFPFAGRALAADKAWQTGTHRTRSPRETFDAYRAFMPAMGITRLANITGLDVIGLPVFAARRPNALVLATSMGKGLDADAARASAMMEAMELWHVENPAPPARLTTRAALLDEGRDAVALDALAALPGQRPDDRHRLWVEGFDLLAERPAWVPLEVISFRDPIDLQPNFWERSSNGLASGNHPLEAMLHALYEVVERDAIALWRHRLEPPHDVPPDRKLDLGAVDDPGCRRILELLAGAGVAAAAWDITSDVGLPTYVCSVMEPPDAGRLRTPHVASGSGTHLAPHVALSRALSEAVQVRTSLVAGARDTFTREAFATNLAHARQAERWRILFEPPARWSTRSAADRSTPTLQGDLRVVLDALRRAGIAQAVAVELTSARFGIPVFKLVVPALEALDTPPRGRARRFAAAEAP